MSVKHVHILFLCAALLAASCKSPTDVDAYRDRKVQQPPTTDLTELEIGENNIDFGGIPVYDLKSIQVTLFNTSEITPLEIRSLAFKNNSGEFRIDPVSATLPLILAPQERAGSDKQIIIQFYPQNAGEFFDTLVLNDSQYITVTGWGYDESGSPSIAINSNPPLEVLQFGDRTLKDTPLDKNISIVNTSGYTITINRCTLDDPDTDSGFKTNPERPYPITLKPNASVNLTITFHPTEIRDYSLKLAFNVDRYLSPVEVCDIRARCVPPGILDPGKRP